MTREQAKALLPIIQAWAEGKTIQHLSDSHTWHDGDMYFDFSDSSNRYRIKPTPTLRPWRPKEVPVGALVRYRKERKEELTGMRGFEMALIVGVSGHRILLPAGLSCNFAFNTMLLNCEHSLDNGKTWLPCGVMEE